MTNASDPASEEDFDDMPEGPVDGGGDEAPSLPTQTADDASGQQYSLPAKVDKAPPTAVNFKLKSDMKVCVAFDYMRVKVGEIAEMQHFTPALLRLFAEEEKRKEEEAAAGAEKWGAGNAKKGKQSKKQNKKQK